MDPLARVLAAPGSISARRALAAQWKAQGDPRGELIERQLAYRDLVHRGEQATPAARALDKEITVAARSLGKTVAGKVASLVDDYELRRGLVAEVTLSGQRFLDVAAELFAAAPIQHVHLTGPLPVDLVFASPYLERLTSLALPNLGDAFGDAGADALARSRHVSNLKWIDLTNDSITEAGAESLAASPYLAQVAFIGLKRNPADATPFVNEDGGVRSPGRPGLAERLERAYGKRPWLAVPSDAAAWPPDRDELAITS